MTLTLRAQAFGPLANVEWTIPPGVSAVVGPNRAGKSTLLALPEFLRLAIHESTNEAVRRVFDGPAYLRTFGLPSSSPCGVGITDDDSSWDLEVTIAGGAIAPHCFERLRWNDEIVLERPFGSTDGQMEGRHIPLGSRSIPDACALHLLRGGIDYTSVKDLPDNDNQDGLNPWTKKAARAALNIGATTYVWRAYRSYKYEIQNLLKYGSVQSDGKELEPSGANVFPLLRNWRDSSDTEACFEFVFATLREAFPHINKVDFEQAGQTVTMAVRDRRWVNQKIAISRESTGLVTALLQLCAVASTPQLGLVTLDEIETSLHPHAIRVLIGAFRRWAKEQDLRIVLATQSETVLDQFHDEPENIFVIEPSQPTTPVALTELFDGNYLNQFSLGDLFSHLEFGSNRDLAKTP